MKRKDFQEPSLEDLKEGNILPIYSNFMFQKKYEGKAELLSREPSLWRSEYPYIRAEIGGTENQDPNVINWSFQRWKVKFVEGPRKGFTTHRYIAYFLCVSHNLSSGFTMYADEEA